MNHFLLVSVKVDCEIAQTGSMVVRIGFVLCWRRAFGCLSACLKKRIVCAKPAFPSLLTFGEAFDVIIQDSNNYCSREREKDPVFNGFVWFIMVSQ